LEEKPKTTINGFDWMMMIGRKAKNDNQRIRLDDDDWKKSQKRQSMDSIG